MLRRLATTALLSTRFLRPTTTIGVMGKYWMSSTNQSRVSFEEEEVGALPIGSVEIEQEELMEFDQVQVMANHPYQHIPIFVIRHS